jgi:hypothetical protein
MVLRGRACVGTACHSNSAAACAQMMAESRACTTPFRASVAGSVAPGSCVAGSATASMNGSSNGSLQDTYALLSAPQIRCNWVMWPKDACDPMRATAACTCHGRVQGQRATRVRRSPAGSAWRTAAGTWCRRGLRQTATPRQMPPRPPAAAASPGRSTRPACPPVCTQAPSC